MATYTDVFSGTDDEIAEAFAWMLPAVFEDRGPREVKNPFTGQKMTVTGGEYVVKPSRAWNDRNPSAAEKKKMEALPHELWKGISFWELSGLCTVLLGEGDWVSGWPVARRQVEGESALYSFPAALEDALAELKKKAVAETAASWCETEEGTDVSEEDARAIIERLRELAVMGKKRGRRLYLQM